MEENPFSRVSRTLSKGGNLAGFRPLNSVRCGLTPAVTGLTAAKRRSTSMHKISRSQPTFNRRLRLQFADSPSWRAIATLSKLCRNSVERVRPQDPHMDRLDQLLTPTELAGYLGVPVATLYAWRHRRQGPPSFKAGRHLRYRLSDVERWIADRVQEPHGGTHRSM